MDGYGSGGGSVALCKIIEKCGGSVYADLLREYGVDLRDLFSDIDPLTPRRALVLIQELPTHTKTSALMSDAPDAYGWRVSDYLLAGVINAVRDNTFTNIQVRTKKKMKPFDPFPVPVEKKEKKPRANAFVLMAQANFNKSKEG